MKLTNRQLIALGNALTALDGERSPDGSVRRYKFLGNVRYAAARSLMAIKGLRGAFDKAHQDIVEDVSDGKGTIDARDPKFRECTKRIEALLDEEVEVDPYRVKLKDLAIEENQLPSTVVADLWPIIDEG